MRLLIRLAGTELRSVDQTRGLLMMTDHEGPPRFIIDCKTEIGAEFKAEAEALRGSASASLVYQNFGAPDLDAVTEVTVDDVLEACEGPTALSAVVMYAAGGVHAAAEPLIASLDFDRLIALAEFARDVRDAAGTIAYARGWYRGEEPS